MPDIFNRSTDTFGGSFSADLARVTFPALTGGIGADTGLLMQNLSATYTQQVSRLFELSSPTIYYVAGRTAGNANVSRVIGPRKVASQFYSTYGDVCRARTNTLNFSVSTGCDAGVAQLTRSSYVAHFVVLTTMGVNVGAADMLISESLAFMFSSFLYV